MLHEAEAVKLADGLNHEHASLLALIEIAFNGVLDANIRLTENLVVFGLGPIGQLVMQMARLNGARVIAVDALPKRLELAKMTGADLVVNFKETDVINEIYDFTGGRGADVVLEVSGNISALTTATKACCYNGRLVVLSFYQHQADSLFLGNEFHHKRLRLFSSQICGLSPELVSWDMKRRKQAVLKLLPQLSLESLISSRVRFENLPAALASIDQDPASSNAVIIKY